MEPHQLLGTANCPDSGVFCHVLQLLFPSCRSGTSPEFELYSIIVVTVIDDQQNATFLFIYVFPISSTCFGQCFRQSSGALD